MRVVTVEPGWNESKGVPAMALTLSAYEYTIIYRPGKDHSHADALSHLSLPQTPSVVPVLGNLLLREHLDTVSPVTARQIRAWTDKDTVLAQVEVGPLKS